MYTEANFIKQRFNQIVGKFFLNSKYKLKLVRELQFLCFLAETHPFTNPTKVPTVVPTSVYTQQFHTSC